MTTKGYRKESGLGKGEIREIDGGGYLIPSFSTPGKFYKVHPDSGYCSCKRHQYTGSCVKHIVLAEAVQNARSLKSGSFVAEENVIELCQRIFAPLTNDAIASYNLFLETVAYKHSTEAMLREVLRRHGRVLALVERSAA